jgi:hypothetical protein
MGPSDQLLLPPCTAWLLQHDVKANWGTEGGVKGFRFERLVSKLFFTSLFLVRIDTELTGSIIVSFNLCRVRIQIVPLGQSGLRSLVRLEH